MRKTLFILVAGLMAVATACPSDDGPTPTPSTVPTTEAVRDPEPQPDEELLDPVSLDLYSFPDPQLKGDFVVQAPDLFEPPTSGQVVDLREGFTGGALFDLGVIAGDHVPIFSSWAMNDHGLAAYVYVSELPDEGLKSGNVEVGVLVRALESDDPAQKQHKVLSIAPMTPTSPDEPDTTDRAMLVKVFAAGDRLVVVDFYDAQYWVINASGNLTMGTLSSPVAVPSCSAPGASLPGGDDCIDFLDVGYISGPLSAIEAGPTMLVLTNEMRANSGSVPLLSIELDSGAVTGPTEWRVSSSVLAGDARPTCVIGAFCMTSTTAKSDGVDVMNRFNPVSLERDLVPVPEALTRYSPNLFADGILWTGDDTVFTDYTGASERWRLGTNINVRAAYDGADAAVLLAQNANGEIFWVDPATGVENGSPELDSFDNLIAMNDRWLLRLKAGELLAEKPPT